MTMTDSTRQKFYDSMTVQEYNKRGKLHKWVNILASRGDTTCRKFLHDHYNIKWLPTTDINHLNETHYYTPPPKPSIYHRIPLRPDARASLSPPRKRERVVVRYTYKQLREMILQDKIRKGELVLTD